MSGEEIKFDDVALYFSAEEWETLEKWQKKLYRDVMVDHYQTLLSVGLMKVIPEVILKIMMGEEPAVNHKSTACVCAPETLAPETLAPETLAPETLAPETLAPETLAPETLAPETLASETPAPETLAPETPAPDMSPARPQGTTSLKQTLGNVQNNTSGTTMNLRHKKLNLPLEIFPRSTRHKEKAIHKKSEVQQHILENHSVSDIDQLPAVDKQTQGEKHYICVDCGKTFGHWSSLVTHTTSNCCVRPHSCSDCGASFINQSQLLSHQKTHSSSKSHECPTCRKHFPHKSSLEVHIRSHTGERPFICNLCNKRFKEHGNLRRHERIHTGEKPFRCDTCGKCFNDSSVMTRHQKVYCPSKKDKLEKSHPETVNPTDLDVNCEVRSDTSNTYVEDGKVCISLLTPRAKVMESGQGDLQFSADAKMPTMKALNNTSSTFQEITSNHMKPIDTSGKHDNEYRPSTVHGGNTNWSVETPVPNTHMKGIVDKCENYFILVLPPTQTSNTQPNTRTMSEENPGKDTDSRVNSHCEDHQNATNGSVETKREKDISLYSVCGPHEGPADTNTNMVAQIAEVNDQQYSISVKQECEDNFLENAKFESQSSPPPSGVKCEMIEQAVTQQITSFIQEELKTVEDTSGFSQDANQESPQVISATQVCDAFSQHSKAKNQETSSNQKVGMKTRSQEPGADEKPSQCAESGKRLNDPSSLNTHNNQKAETKMIQEPGANNKHGTCNQCGENYTYNSHSFIPHRCHTKKKKLSDSDCGFQHGLQLDQQQKAHSGHTCQECGRTFRYKDILILHLRTHTEDGRPYPCTECGKAFKEARGLQRHLEIHTREKPSEHDVSGERFNDPLSLNMQKVETKMRSQEPGADEQGTCNQRGESFTYNSHSLIPHTKKKYQCDCGKSFQHSFELKRHRKTHRPHTCHECGRTFRYKAILTLHLRTHSEDMRPYPCTKCDKAFMEARGLQRHFEIHTREKPSEHVGSGERFNNSSSPNKLNNQKAQPKTRSQELADDDKQKTCNQCGESYMCNSLSLIPHICNTEKKIFQCDCGRSFQDDFQLKQHQKTYSDHKCQKCGRAFRSEANLLLHLPTHIEDRPYSCTECGKAFKDATKLQRHLRSHTGEKPFQCGESGITFDDRSSVNRPGNQTVETKTRSQDPGAEDKQRTCNRCGEKFTYNCRRLILHRCVTKKKLFQCDCGQGFQHAFQLELHQKTHSEHKCQMCGKAFRNKANLVLHLQTHTKDRPYPCVECGKAFKEASKLRRHLRIHTGEKPFQCPECGRMFNDPSSLNRHRKVHIGKAH